MARRKTRHGFIILLVFLVGVALFITAYLKNTQTEHTHAFVVKYFDVSDFKVENEKLELHGNFNGSDWNQNKTQTLIIGGLEEMIKDLKSITRHSYKLEKYTLPKQLYFTRDMRVKDVNCLAIINGDENELARAIELDKTKRKVPYSAEHYTKLTSNCSNFINDRGYIMDALTEEERNFSVAFSVLMYKDIEQTERLLRAIYRPQHWFCFHIDSKTNVSIYQAMKNIADCFENVFILDKRYNVTWGAISVLEPEIRCMEHFWETSKTWKYFINLTGQEFPLRSNYELIQILQAYNGSNDVSVSDKGTSKKYRWKLAGLTPHGIVPKKGPVHITASRGFVHYVLHDQRAHDFFEWTKKTIIPDETFFASLNHNPILDVPGSYKGSPDNNSSRNSSKPLSVSRFKNWGGFPCAGRIVRGICVFGTGDLPLLASRRGLFANKFHLTYQHYALDCMEELHYNHTRDEYLGKRQFDAQWYAQLPFVSH